MMCKCCKGENGSCKCMHHKVEKMVLGLVLLVLAVILYCHNYGYMGSKLLCGPSTDMWSWFIPGVVGLIGLKLMVLGCMRMMHGKKNDEECKDGKGCKCEEGKCTCNKDEMKKE